MTGSLFTPPPVLFSKSAQCRREFIEEHLGLHKGTVLHLHPKNLARKPYAPGVVLATYEDITKRDVWLRVNSLIGDGTLLVLENPSRYPKITSEKVRFLRRLSMRLRGPRVVCDVVPFTLSVEYLYTPYSYIGREILGYPHWYAFRENYQELAEDGSVVNALDFPVLAKKAAQVTAIDYPHFLAPCRSVVAFEESEPEAERYRAKREELLTRYESEASASATPPQKIITRLADLTHAFPSRQSVMVETVADLLGQTEGRVVVVCNLQSYATAAQKALRAAGLPERCTATSYQVGAEREDWSTVGAVVYAEAPIVHSFYRLDIEASLPEGCLVRELRGRMKIDQYLGALIEDECQQIDGFTRALYKECHDSKAF